MHRFGKHAAQRAEREQPGAAAGSLFRPRAWPARPQPDVPFRDWHSSAYPAGLIIKRAVVHSTMPYSSHKILPCRKACLVSPCHHGSRALLMRPPLGASTSSCRLGHRSLRMLASLSMVAPAQAPCILRQRSTASTASRLRSTMALSSSHPMRSSSPCMLSRRSGRPAQSMVLQTS